jgi:hypothetical protein
MFQTVEALMLNIGQYSQLLQLALVGLSWIQLPKLVIVRPATHPED